MIGIVLVAHGGLAHEYLTAVEHVVGKHPGIVAISMEYNHDRTFKQDEICAAADSVDTGHGVVVVADMFGASPCNLALKSCECSTRKVLYGANLPMLVKLAKMRGTTVEQAAKAAVAAGRKYIDEYNG